MTQTIVQTRIARIAGKKVKVETTKGEGRQDINYIVNGNPVKYNAFWESKPSFIKTKN